MMRHLPNTLTCLNLALGCLGIYALFADFQLAAFYFVLLAAAFDFADGLAARLLGVQSEVGKQLDSLADLVSFGLLPAFFMLKQMEGMTSFFWVAISIAVFSAIRLARFNVDDTQADSFKGLPTPANAIMLTSLIFFPVEVHSYILLSICLFSCIMLVSPVKLIALKFKSLHWKGNEPRWILIVAIVLSTIILQMGAIPYLIPFYIAWSLISNVLVRKEFFMNGKRS